MRRNLLILGALILMLAVSASVGFYAYGKKSRNDVSCCQGNSGKMVEKTFPVSGEFKAITVSNCLNVLFTQTEGASPREFQAQLSEELAERVEVKVENGTLFVGVKKEYRNKPQNPNGKCLKGTLYVSGPKLEKVTINGAGDLKVKNGLRTANGFECTVSGAGDFECKSLEAVNGHVKIQVSGAGDVDVDSLQASTLDVGLSGAGDIDLKGMETGKTTVRLSGAGDIELAGKSRVVEISASGAGDVDASKLEAESGTVSSSGASSVKCNVRNLTKSVSGAGSVKNKQ